jgi:SMODS and SLOG-associating 2TM effector domain 2
MARIWGEGFDMLEASKTGTSDANANWVVWDASDPLGALARLYAATIKRASQQIDWYKVKVRPKRLGSQVCRFLAIVLLGLAALIPLLKAAGIGQSESTLPAQGAPQTQPLGPNTMRIAFELGYVFAAVAAGIIAFDKYFGLSTGWIRYIQTELALEGALDELHYDWVALLAKIQGQNPTPEQAQTMIQRLRSFIVLVNGQTQKETEGWVMEFQANLADLEKAAKARAQEQKPGRVEVTVANAHAFESGVTASLDGMDSRALEGTSCVFGSVAPGPHIVSAKGAKGDKMLQASEIIRVQPDSVASVSLTLPNP